MKIILNGYQSDQSYPTKKNKKQFRWNGSHLDSEKKYFFFKTRTIEI